MIWIFLGFGAYGLYAITMLVLMCLDIIKTCSCSDLPGADYSENCPIHKGETKWGKKKNISLE